MIDARVISIGTLAEHPLWGEATPLRTPHATTTLVRAADAAILVDPSLPEPAIVARLHERSGLTPDRITHVFLTSFRPDIRRGIRAFPNAKWLISATEREAAGVPLAQRLRAAAEDNDDELVQLLGPEVALLRSMLPADESIAEGVELFPLPGVTPGLTGLLLDVFGATLLIAGDAVVSREHARRRMVAADSTDIEAARASLSEALEIADLIIPGRDDTLVLDYLE